MPLKKTFVAIVLISIISTVIFSIFYRENTNGKIVTPLGKKPTFTEIIARTLTPKPKLAALIEEELAGKTGTYAVVVKNLKTGEAFSINENYQFIAASLYKLWVMGQAYEEINNGNLNESDSVSLSRGEIEAIQGFRQEDVRNNTYYSVADAIQNMITVSDNDSAITLYTHMGTDKITGFLKKYNFANSVFETPPKTTAKDITDYFNLLYNGRIVNRDYSIKMLQILIQQKLNDRIPKYLPQEIKIAHKTGELDTFKHDAGIINGPNGDYILVVLTDTPDPQSAAENIAVLSQKIYDYFSNQRSTINN